MKNYLAVWLAFRGKTITDMSRATGLSRTTLTSIAKQRAKGIEFETLNKICYYLDITPNELFEENLLSIAGKKNAKKRKSREQGQGI